MKDEKSALLVSSSSRAETTSSQYFYIAKVSSFITILIILIIALVINHPTKVENVSESFSNFANVYGNAIVYRTKNNESNILFVYCVIII
jgi:hypothetical protein